MQFLEISKNIDTVTHHRDSTNNEPPYRKMKTDFFLNIIKKNPIFVSG